MYSLTKFQPGGRHNNYHGFDIAAAVRYATHTSHRSQKLLWDKEEYIKSETGELSFSSPERTKYGHGVSLIFSLPFILNIRLYETLSLSAFSYRCAHLSRRNACSKALFFHRRRAVTRYFPRWQSPRCWVFQQRCNYTDYNFMRCAPLKSGSKLKSKATPHAMLSVNAIVGYLILNVFSTSSNISGDICTTLFGSTSILTLSRSDVWISIVMSAAVIIIFLLFYNKIFAVTFDEAFSAAVGIRAGVYNMLIAIVTAVIIVLAMNLVGSLLISALVIFPSLSAMRVYKSFRAVVICSAVLSVLCSAIGIIISILASTPVGSTIVIANIVTFSIFSAVGALVGHRRGA